jgi:hypothetical protein
LREDFLDENGNGFGRSTSNNDDEKIGWLDEPQDCMKGRLTVNVRRRDVRSYSWEIMVLIYIYFILELLGRSVGHS